MRAHDNAPQLAVASQPLQRVAITNSDIALEWMTVEYINMGGGGGGTMKYHTMGVRKEHQE